MNRGNVLILGAGASYHLGYPTGEGLINSLKNWHNGRKIYCSNGLEGDLLSMESLYRVPFFDDLIQINNIPKYKNFFSALNENQVFKNIDTFLRNHPDQQEIGKQLIAAEILRCENRIWSTSENWYGQLVDSLVNCEDPEEILQSDLSIITFNYDVSLEYFLYDQLLKMPKFFPYLKDICEILQNRIIHVYGSVREASFEDIYKSYGNFYGSFKQEVHPTILLNEANKSSLEVIYGDKHKNRELPHIQSACELIYSAKKIYVLGFGFDINNTDLLKLSKLRSDQELLYTNFGNNGIINDRVKKLCGNNLLFKCSPKTVHKAFSEDFDLR